MPALTEADALPEVSMLKLGFFQVVGASLVALAALSPAQAAVQYEYEVGVNGFTFTAPGLTTGIFAAYELDSCSFEGFTCTSLELGANSFRVFFAEIASGTTPTSFGMSGCPVFAVGGSYTNSFGGCPFAGSASAPSDSVVVDSFLRGTLTITGDGVGTVPEPGSLALLGLGLAVLAAMRRRGTAVQKSNACAHRRQRDVSSDN